MPVNPGVMLTRIQGEIEMAVYIFDLDFRGGDVEQCQLPGAVARILLKACSRDESGLVYISNDCMGPTELEVEVNRLKAELDELLRRGRKRFKEYKSRTKDAISRKQHSGGRV